MALSYRVVTGDGVAQEFDLNFGYLRRDHVFVFVDDELVTFRFETSNRVRILSIPPPGSEIKLKRITDHQTRVVDFQDGQTLLAGDLDASALQLLYLIQETIDNLSDSEGPTVIDGNVTLGTVGEYVADILPTAILDDPYYQQLLEELQTLAEAQLQEVQDRIADVQAETDARTAALLAEITNRLDGDAAVQALVVDEATTRESETSANATAIAAVAAQINTPTTGLLAVVASQQEAIVDLEEGKAEASALTLVQAEIENARDGEANLLAKVASLDLAIVDGDSANAQSILDVQANLDDESARITDNTQAIVDEVSARAYQDSLLEADIDGVNATATANTTAIAAETGARVSAVSGLQAQHTSLDEKTRSRTNLIPYGDLSDGSANWYKAGYSFQDQWQGPRLVYDSTGTPYAEAPAFLVFPAGGNLTAGASINDNRSTNPIKIQFVWYSSYDGTGTPVGYSPSSGVLNSEGRKTITAIPHAAANSAKVRFYSDGSDSGYVDIREVSAVIGTADVRNPIQSNSGRQEYAKLTTAKADIISNANAIATETSARATQYDSLEARTITAAGRNLVPNANMANNGEGWTFNGSSYYGIGDDVGPYGHASAPHSSVVSPFTPVTANWTYTFSAKAGGGYTGDLTGGIWWYDSGYNFLSGADVYFDTGGYHYRTLTRTAPSNAAYARVFMYPQANFSGWSLGFRFKLEHGTVATMWNDETTLTQAHASIKAAQAAITTESSARATAVTQINAQLGGGGNLLSNPAFQHKDSPGTTGPWASASGAVDPPGWEGIGAVSTGSTWNFAWVDGGYTPFGDAWIPKYEHGFVIEQFSAGDPGNYWDLYSEDISVEQGKRYCASGWLGVHRCSARMYIFFWDKDDAWLGVGNNVTTVEAPNGGPAGGTNIASFKRCWHMADAPTGAVRARLVFRKWNTVSPETSSYLFGLRPQFEQLAPDATEPAPYGGNGKAQANIIYDALSTNDLTRAYLAFNVNTGTNDATLELISQNGGAWNGSAINLTASYIRLNGNVIINGTALGDILVGRAITDAVYDEQSGEVATTGSWATFASATVTCEDDDEVDLAFSAAVRAVSTYSANHSGTQIEMRILRGATEIYPGVPVGYIAATDRLVSLEPTAGGSATLYDQKSGETAYAHPGGIDLDIPGAGTHTYYLQFRHVGSNPSWYVKNRRLKVTRRYR